ncbi:nuclear transport factor 2 family protein [Rhizobium sp. LjRoot98]|uniref:nuclear transport factor 2 family protein n=1 Tax=unclassified Rhizobium TaxID=2613769 RepID=UPI000714A6F9|nr:MULTISPECIES: nuclear transport factor 2 family protein [unclassified Rhizobium]KQV39677.1 ketosteroid isomerase [Rhizobium sp. Root1204]KQY01984.1 ketosteroid isomerase [Rhizobium sp. Root1334]KRB97554.1 ketosteroid isomerase [Rhizobium sp. Root73]
MDREATVRGLFAAYLANRKDEVSDMLTEDFTFSSPNDDHINKATYFERCWPQPPAFSAIHIERISLEDNEALVRYRADKRDGGAFRNVEIIRFHGDRIASVEVYFGRDA